MSAGRPRRRPARPGLPPLLLDVRCLQWPRWRGAHRYCFEVARRLVGAWDGRVELHLGWGPGVDWPVWPVEVSRLVGDGAVLVRHDRSLAPSVHVAADVARRRHGIYVRFHGDDTLPLPPGRIPMVPVVHDLRGHAGGAAPPSAVRVVRRAATVVAVSATVRDGLVAAVPGAAGKVVVAPPAPDLPAGRQAPGGVPDAPWAVVLGGADHNKRIDWLLRAWPAVAATCPSASLVLVGDMTAYAAEVAAAERAWPGRVHHLAWVSPEEKAWLVEGAAVLVSTSSLEGFGMPLVEAALLGTPVVCTDLPVYREVLGDDGARYVPLDDTAGLVDAWCEALTGRCPPERVERARARAARFSGDATAEAVRSALGDIAGRAQRPRVARASANTSR